jgi:hypothetical protein
VKWLIAFHPIVLFTKSHKQNVDPVGAFDTHVLLSECKADISAHLASCHLSHCLNVTESELILARAGIRGLSSTHLAPMTICPKHRHLLGRFWRPPKSCQYPNHSGKKTSVAGRHVINWQMAEEIYLLFGISTAVGSRKYILFSVQAFIVPTLLVP